MLRDIGILLRAFGELCIFRRAPQDLPPSRMLLVIAGLANLGLGTAISLAQLPPVPALGIALLEMGLAAAVTALLLYPRALGHRVLQTLIALFGCSAVINASVLVLMQGLPTIPGSLRFLVFVWNVAVVGNILRHALGVGLAAGILVAIGYAAVSYVAILTTLVLYLESGGVIKP